MVLTTKSLPYHQLLMGFDGFDGDKEDALIVLVGHEIPRVRVWRGRHPFHPVAVSQAGAIDNVHWTSVAPSIDGGEDHLELRA